MDHIGGIEGNQPAAKRPVRHNLRISPSRKKQIPATTFPSFELLPLEIRRRIWKYYIRDQACIIEISEPSTKLAVGKTCALPDILCINREIRIDAFKVYGYYIYEDAPTTREWFDYAHHPERCLGSFGAQDISKSHVYFRAKTDMLFINSSLRERLPDKFESLTLKAKESMRCIAFNMGSVWDWDGIIDPKTLKIFKGSKTLKLILVVADVRQAPKKRMGKFSFEKTSVPFYWISGSPFIISAMRQVAAVQSGLTREEDGVLVTPEVRFVKESHH